jgi:hypothetical protein
MKTVPMRMTGLAIEDKLSAHLQRLYSHKPVITQQTGLVISEKIFEQFQLPG